MLAALSLFIYAIYRPRWWLFLSSSFLLGIGSLVRPTLLLLPLFLAAVVILYWRLPRKWLVCSLLTTGIILAWTPWAVWSKTQVPPDKEGFSNALVTFASGTYPDLTFKNPKNRGFPYQDDPEWETFRKDWGLTIDKLLGRASREPIKYVKWYLLGKPAMFWSWNIIAGQGDIYVYPVTRSYYQYNSLASLTRAVMRFLHPIVVAICFLGFISILLRPRTESDRSYYIFGITIFSVMIYFTVIHSVLLPLPRYSIPLRPVLYLGTLFSLDLFLRNRNYYMSLAGQISGLKKRVAGNAGKSRDEGGSE
jgi:4-amino-4-deoxy-L-arabinose transferase-like glycosyltransferase